MNHKQLIFAREFRGLSQTELSKSISGLSQSNLSKFEKGIGVLSDDVINKILYQLDFPESFLHRKVNSVIENANYRKRASVTKSSILKFENKCRIIGYIIDEFSQSIEWPDFTLTALNVEDGYAPEYVAQYARRSLGIERDEPVRNIYSLLEAKGVIIYEIDDIDKFDGVSFFTDKGFPIIIVNKNFSNDRKRFTIAHELGHILLHDESNFPISEFRNKELEANQFASEFLMPRDAISNSLRNLKMSDLGELKNYWLTSMSSIIRKARDMKRIDDYRYKFFMIEMSRHGYTKKEPIEVPIDKPTCFKNAVNLFKHDLSYTDEDFIESTALPRDVIDDIINSDKLVRLKLT